MIPPIKFDTLRNRWMRDPQFRAAYDKISPEMEIALGLRKGIFTICWPMIGLWHWQEEVQPWVLSVELKID